MLPIEISYLPVMHMCRLTVFFILFFIFLQKVHFPVLMYNFPLKNAYYHMNICTVSQLKRNN